MKAVVPTRPLHRLYSPESRSHGYISQMLFTSLHAGKLFPQIMSLNKAVYTAALVADGWAGAENLEKWRYRRNRISPYYISSVLQHWPLHITHHLTPNISSSVTIHHKSFSITMHQYHRLSTYTKYFKVCHQTPTSAICHHTPYMSSSASIHQICHRLSPYTKCVIVCLHAPK